LFSQLSTTLNGRPFCCPSIIMSIISLSTPSLVTTILPFYEPGAPTLPILIEDGNIEWPELLAQASTHRFNPYPKRHIDFRNIVSTRRKWRASTLKRLSIIPRPPHKDEAALSDYSLSDYSPPPDSRAGEFLRLTMEGRREEAVDRERRRASYGVLRPPD
jgi:hypothetical protein